MMHRKVEWSMQMRPGAVYSRLDECKSRQRHDIVTDVR